MLMRENVNKDVCKDLPIRNFSHAEKAEDPEDKFWYEICMIKVVVASKIHRSITAISGTKFEKQSKRDKNKN